MGSGTCCKYSNNPSLNKLIKKEATYLKIIINSMQEDVEEEPSFITVAAPVSTAPVSTAPVSTGPDSSASVNTTASVPAPAPAIVIEDTNGDIVDLSNEIVPANPEPVSYLSYCVVS